MRFVIKIMLWCLALFAALCSIFAFLDGLVTAGIFFIFASYFASPISALPRFASKLMSHREQGQNKTTTKFLIYFTPVILFMMGLSFIPGHPNGKKSGPVLDATQITNLPAQLESSGQRLEEKSAPVRPELALRQKISDDVFVKYAKDRYPKQFDKFGSRMSDVERARQAGAFLAATNSKCFYVYESEVSDASTHDNIRVFTDCYGQDKKSSERYRFEEIQLRDKSGAFFTADTVAGAGITKTMLEQSFSKEAALALCQSSVRKSAQFPSTVSFSSFNQIVRTSNSSGETWVELEFEAKNGLGAILPYRANCSFPLQGKPTISIINR